MREVVPLIAASVLSIGAAAGAQAPAPATIKPDTGARVVKLLEGSGYRYEKLSNTQWLMNFEGEHLEDIHVYVMVTDVEMTLLGVIGPADEIDQTAGAAQQLLRLNNRRDGLAIYLDGDDDYVVVSRHQFRQMNVNAFKAALQTIVAAADDSFESISAAAPPTPAPAAGALDPQAYRVPASANQVVEFLSGRATISMDAARWTQTKSDEPGRLNFQHVSGDVGAMVIAERIVIPIDKLKEVAFNNAKAVSKDMKIVEEVRRNVNGLEVHLMRMEGTVDGVAFTYLGYYYGGEQGAIQVLTYTGRSLLGEYRSVMEEFLNGFRLK